MFINSRPPFPEEGRLKYQPSPSLIRVGGHPSASPTVRGVVKAMISFRLDNLGAEKTAIYHRVVKHLLTYQKF